MHTQHYDDLTIERWRVEPRVHDLQLGDADEQDQAPPLWKDLTLALAVALLWWMAAAAVFG